MSPATPPDAPEASAPCTKSWLEAVVGNISSEDEDYDTEADGVGSWDDYIDNLFGEQVPEGDANAYGRKDTNYWAVNVVEDGVTKRMNLSVKEAIALPPNRKIILRFNRELQPIDQAAGLLSGFIGSLAADFNSFPICEKSWRTMGKALKDHAYNTIKRVFEYEDDDKGIIKQGILQRIGKNWKESRNNLFHRFYDETLTREENEKRKPSGISAAHWKWFLLYCLDNDTKEKCIKNALNHSKQSYTHTGGSKTLARRRHEEEQLQKKRISRGEIWTMVHKRKDGSYIHDDSHLVGEAIENIERQDESSKRLFQNDSLAQVLEKEHSGRVCGVGLGPCPTQLFGNATQQSNSGVQIEEYQKEIAELKSEAAELKAEAAEEKTKRQTMKNLLRYLIKQQGDNLPPEVAAELDSLGSTTK